MWSACALQEGTVLIARDTGSPPDRSEVDAALDGEAPRDAASDEDSGQDATLDAGPVAVPRGVCKVGGADDAFYDTFSGTTLDATHWLVAHGPVRFAGHAAPGGLVRDNVTVEGGALVLRVRGDRYAGSVRGVNSAGSALTHGRRTGAAVASRDLFASATYQVQGLFTGPAGLEVALWFVRDDEGEGAIDMATPGLASGQSSYAHVRMRSRDASSSAEQQLMLAQPFGPDESHILRFDWYTTANNAVTYWVDDQQRWETMQSLPSRRAGRLWIVAWVPDQAPADFDTAEVRIENAFIRPFGNDGDACRDLELAGPFLTEP
jgi:hypothetical protein